MNECQKIQLDRIKLGSFNSFNGSQVATDIENNENLWTAFVFGRFGMDSTLSYLIELRDLAKDCINADAIMFLTTTDKLKALLKLIKKWKVDEVGYTKVTVGKNHYPEYLSEGTAPFGGADIDPNAITKFIFSLEPGQVIVRAWWD